MNWIKKLIIKWVREDWEEENKKINRNELGVLTASREEHSVSDDPILNFKVYSAIGGKIVEFRQYDKLKDRGTTQIYIVTPDQDFGERIAKIATMESMKI